MSQQSTGYEQELRRTLKLPDLLVYGLVFLVPIAPMGVFGYVASASNGMVPTVYLVGLIAMLFTALSYAKFSKRFPVAGSVYSYVQRGINPHVGFIAGWLILIDYILVPCLCYSFAGVWLESLVPAIPSHAWFIFLVIFNTIINYIGIDWTAKTNWLFFILECILLVVFLVLAIVFISKGGGFGGLSIKPFFQPEYFNMSFIAAATSIAVLSFLGFDGISTLAEETIEPQKNIAKATLLALLIAGLIFMVECYVAALVVPDISTLTPDTAFLEIAVIVGGQSLKIFMTLVLIIASGLANSCVALAAISRILFSMSRDRLMPPLLSKIHNRFQTPYIAVITVSIISLIVGFLVDLNQLIKLVNFGALSSFIFLNFAVFWFFFVKEKQRNLSGIFNYLIFPITGLGIISFVWMGLDSSTKTLGLIWAAIGIVYCAIISKGFREVPEAFKNLDI